MRLESKCNSSLDKYQPPEGAAPPEESLAEAMELLYDLLNGSYQCSGTCLDTEYDGQRVNVQDLYWRCKELLEQAGKDPGKTGFLAMSVLEQTYERAKPLLLCSLEDILSGGTPMPENARKLEKILSDNEYKKIWADRSALYAAILEKIGFEADPDAFSDLTKIMDPLLSALSFYNGDRYQRPSIYKVRDGKPSDNRNPAIARAVCMYRSEKELTDAVMGSGRDAMMAFGAVEKTHAQVKDYFFEWFHGHPDERQRNMMRNENLTAEEYLAAGCDYTRRVYLAVKSGDCCWLVHMPWRGDYYSKIGDQKHEYYYGKRASYAPYQIFYKTAAPAPEGSTMLAIPKTGYLLSELMDPLSMAWYPAFLDETMKTFFRGSVPPSIGLVFSEETAASDPANPEQDGKDAYAVVPVRSGVPATCSWNYRIRQPWDIFPDDGNIAMLFRYFGISSKDIRGIPILPEQDGAPEKLLSETDGRLRKAYLKLLAGKIADLMDGRWDARKWMLGRIQGNMDAILEAAGAGDLMAFMEVTVDGTPVLDPDGTPKMGKRSKYPWDPVPVTVKTSPDDGRDDRRNLEITFAKTVFWYTKPTSGRPPVVWKIRPKNAEQYAAMAGCEEKDLPEILKLSGPLSECYEAYSGSMPQDITDRYTAMCRGPKKRSTYVPCFGALNICMTKKAYKTFDYFK